jgi:prevent-host-death family protein
MQVTAVSMTEARTHLSRLLRRAEAGETVIISRRGKEVARLLPPEPARRPIDLEMLRELTEGMPMSDVPAGEFIRQMRDSDRY